MLQPNPITHLSDLTASLVGVADAVVGMPRRGDGSGIGLVADRDLAAFLRSAHPPMLDVPSSR